MVGPMTAPPTPAQTKLVQLTVQPPISSVDAAAGRFVDGLTSSSDDGKTNNACEPQLALLSVRTCLNYNAVQFAEFLPLNNADVDCPNYFYV